VLGVAGVTIAGVPVGLQLAAAVAADPTSRGHVMLPVMLIGKRHWHSYRTVPSIGTVARWPQPHVAHCAVDPAAGMHVSDSRASIPAYCSRFQIKHHDDVSEPVTRGKEIC
jgi:hypothetical protein